MPNSPRMSWPYPAENVESWYEAFKTFVQAMDSSGFASREDRHLILSGGNVVTWDGASSTLDWTGIISLVSPITGFQIQMAPASVTVEDGQVIYAVITRAPTRNVTVLVAIEGQVPNTDTAITLAVRVGNRIYWRNGLLLDSGESVTNLGAKQGGGGGSPLGVNDEGAPLVANCNLMDFVGSGVVAAVTGPNQVSVTIPGTPTGAASGDLTGTYPSPTVAKIRGTNVVTPLTPNNGDVLTWDGPNSRWDAAVAGASTDRRTPFYVVGNAPNGDTAVVCDFLDVGDGVQLAAALAAAGAGKDVYVRPGTYDYALSIVAAALAIPPSVKLRGAGRGHTIIKTNTSGDQGAFSLGAGSELEDVTVHVGFPVGAGSGASGVVELNGDFSEVRRVRIEWPGVYTPVEVALLNLFASFLIGSSVEHTKVIDCQVGIDYEMPQFSALGGSESYGLAAPTGPSSVGCDVVRFFCLGADIGVFGERTIRVNECELIEQRLNGIYILGVQSRGSQVVGNHIESASLAQFRAIGLDDTSFCDVMGNYLLRGPAGAAGMYGIYLTNAVNCSIGGNREPNGFQFGAYLDAGSSSNIVSRNQFADGVSDLGPGNEVVHNF